MTPEWALSINAERSPYNVVVMVTGWGYSQEPMFAELLR